MKRKRARVNNSHYHMTTMDMGQIIPIDVQEVIPGDTMVKATSALVRCSPLNFPVMHKVHVLIEHHYIPNRIIWPDFEKFITGGENGEDATVHPTMTLATTDFQVGSLFDHMGVPPVEGAVVNALPIRAYQKLYNWRFRDQQLVTAIPVGIGNGNDTTTSRAIQTAAWEKDYQTTCRPEPQLGESVEIPLGTSAPIIANSPGLGSQYQDAGGGNVTDLKRQANLFNGNPIEQLGGDYTDAAPHQIGTSVSGPQQDAEILVTMPGDMTADLTAATAVQIRELRQLSAIQIMRETRNNEGARYPEYTRSSFGVVPADARLQEPEYLGGGRQTIQFSEVLQTAPETGEGVGNMAGHGIGTVRSNAFKRHFSEHGFVITVIIVRPVAVYADSLHRSWMRQIKEDYYQPELAAIGDQMVYKGEVFLQGTAADTEGFGFNKRYAEYHHMPSQISGNMRTTLSGFHFARQLGSMPALDSAFINCFPSTDPFQSTSDGQLWVYTNHKVKMKRVIGSNVMPRLI